MQNPFVVMEGISKSFGDNKALNGVDLGIEGARVTALLGENGAGKTTLVNILSGLYHPDSGRIKIEGKEVRFRSPNDALRHGIMTVHQHFQLIDNFTVFENIILGTSSREEDARSTVTKIISEYGLSVPLDVKIKKLQVGQRQKVEIIKALFRKPKLLILDEPTTNLTPQETDTLFSAIGKLVSDGLTVVFITHKIKEALSIADHLVILRNGKCMGSFQKGELTEDNIIRLMIGDKAVEPIMDHTDKPIPQANTVLVELECVTVLDGKMGHLLRDVTLQLREGEIVGVAGISGNGQKELVEVIAGARKVSSGRVLIMGKDATTLSSSEIIRLGVRYIPEDRINDGLLPSMTLAENIALGHHRNEPFANGILLNQEMMRDKAKQLVNSLQIKSDGLDTKAWKLSGGNIQKLLLARSMLANPRVILAHNPTRGLDVKSTNFVLNYLIELRNKGCCVLLISEDLDELMSICDRIIVISSGKVSGAFERKDFDKYEIGRRMLSYTTERGVE